MKKLLTLSAFLAFFMMIGSVSYAQSAEKADGEKVVTTKTEASKKECAPGCTKACCASKADAKGSGHHCSGHEAAKKSCSGHHDHGHSEGSEKAESGESVHGGSAEGKSSGGCAPGCAKACCTSKK